MPPCADATPAEALYANKLGFVRAMLTWRHPADPLPPALHRCFQTTVAKPDISSEWTRSTSVCCAYSSMWAAASAVAVASLPRGYLSACRALTLRPARARAQTIGATRVVGETDVAVVQRRLVKWGASPPALRPLARCDRAAD